MRAHVNCVENLPVCTAIVIALVASGVRSPVIYRLALALLAARIVHTTVHITLPSTPVTASLQLALFFLQIICMIAMGMMTAVLATP